MKPFWTLLYILILVLSLSAQAWAQFADQPLDPNDPSVVLAPLRMGTESSSLNVEKSKTLGLREITAWAYTEMINRGMPCYFANLKGKWNPCAAIRPITWAPRGYEVLTLALGGEFGRLKGKDAAVTLKNLDFMAAVPINLLEATRPIWGTDSFKRNFKTMKIPGNLQIWIGPSFRIPTSNIKHWRLDEDFGLFASLTKRLG